MPFELSPSTADWLCGPDGRRAVTQATADLDADTDPIVLGTRLRRDGLDPDRATAVIGAATARRRARDRWPDADELLFTPIGLEQASDPEVAAWRARRFVGERVWDLGAGLGSDALAMAAAGAEVTAVDLDAGRLRLLRHNAEVRGLDLTTRVGDALELDIPPGVLLHADPGRRREGRRVRTLADHQPPVGRLLARHAQVEGVGLVLSPAVDLDDPDLPGDAELEFVGDASGLRETVVWLGRLRRPGTDATATLLPEGAQRHRTGTVERCEVGEVGRYLVEPVPAAVRARLHDQIGHEIGGWRVARRRSLLSCDDRPPPSAWYRARPVLAVLPPRVRAVRRWLQTAGLEPLEIAVHGLAADPQRWWRELGRPARGPQGRRLELIRTDEGGLAVLTDAGPGASPVEPGEQGTGPETGPT